MVAAMEAQLAVHTPFQPGAAAVLETRYRPWVAYAYAMNGDVQSASALIARSPADCYLCVRIRALIASSAGDRAGAQRWFSEAVRQAPDLPAAYREWGAALFGWGELAGAAEKLALAHEKGPRCADPLKAWGDVLAKQGKTTEALAKYDEAVRLAPEWGALKSARQTLITSRT
jgi:tetratricopeptide (TPR) repeat protein